jgi:hypothetical protein
MLTQSYIFELKMKRGVMIAPPVVNDVRVIANETGSASTVYNGRFTTVSELSQETESH